MLKKLLVAAAAAVAVSVPLAGLAGADPGDPQNGGGQGNGPGNIGIPPGNLISQIAQQPDSNPPSVFGTFGFKSPGQAVKASK
jgi:hypothetical protein